MTHSRMAAFALAVGGLFASTAALAADPARCGEAGALQIRGDVPAAISFDVYRQLHPLSAQRIALFQSAGTVRRLADGLSVCQIADDGVDDPSAVLVRLPKGDNVWWVSSADVQAADPTAD